MYHWVIGWFNVSVNRCLNDSIVEWVIVW